MLRYPLKSPEINWNINFHHLDTKNCYEVQITSELESLDTLRIDPK